MTKTRIFVLATFVVIGTFDVLAGVQAALSSQPWELSGMGARFTPLLERGGPELAAALLGPYVRLAAFSFHVGVLTLFLAHRFRNDRSALSALFALYTVDGLGFAYYDHGFAAGTGYFYVKQALGTLWVAALVAHVVEGRRLPAKAPESA